MTSSSRHNACADLCLILIAIFLPPVAVAFKRGVCNADFVINIALCILGFIPGLIHAIYIVAKYPRSTSVTDSESAPLLGQ